MSLYFALKSQAKKDLSLERQNLFQSFLLANPYKAKLYRFLDNFCASGMRSMVCIWVAAITVWPRKYKTLSQYIAVYLFENEKAKITEILSQVEMPFRNVSLRSSFLHFFLSPWWYMPAALSDLRRFFRTITFVRRRLATHPLYVSIRLTQTLFYYMQFQKNFFRKNILFSSEGNPHGSALMGLSAAGKLKAIFASHGPVTSQPIKIHCDCAIFCGQRALKLYQDCGSQIGSVLFYGFKDKYHYTRDFDFKKYGRILICLSKNPDRENIKKLVSTLKDEKVFGKITIRSHPNSLFNLQDSVPRGVDVSMPTTPLLDILPSFNFVMAGNTTAHLEAMLNGVPTAYLPDLERSQGPLLCFLNEGLVSKVDLDRVSEKSLREIILKQSAPDARTKLAEYYNLEYGNAEFTKKINSCLNQMGR